MDHTLTTFTDHYTNFLFDLHGYTLCNIIKQGKLVVSWYVCVCVCVCFSFFLLSWAHSWKKTTLNHFDIITSKCQPDCHYCVGQVFLLLPNCRPWHATCWWPLTILFWIYNKLQRKELMLLHTTRVCQCQRDCCKPVTVFLLYFFGTTCSMQ